MEAKDKIQSDIDTMAKERARLNQLMMEQGHPMTDKMLWQEQIKKLDDAIAVADGKLQAVKRNILDESQRAYLIALLHYIEVLLGKRTMLFSEEHAILRNTKKTSRPKFNPLYKL